jgi:hypothetical protein
MLQVINQFWTVLSAIFSTAEDLAVSANTITGVIRINAENFNEQEMIEARAKTDAIRAKYALPE